MRTTVNIFFVVALLVSLFFARKASLPAGGGENPDSSNIILAFGLYVLAAVSAGTLFVTFLLPIIGEWVGNFFYSPVSAMEPEPHAAALAKVAQGDFEGAVFAYAEVLKANPADALALGELVRIEAHQLQRPEAAAIRLEQALAMEWPPEDAAFLAFRLADFYAGDLASPERAVALLRQVMAAMPETLLAAQAERRVREVESGPPREHSPKGLL